MHSYTAALRIAGKALNTDEVSKRLALNPTYTRQVGQRLSESRTYDTALWSYEAVTTGNDTHWASLEFALASLLQIFLPLKYVLAEYSERFEVFLWCGHFSSGFSGGPKFSPGLLKGLADLNVTLYIDTYFSRDDSSVQ